MSHYNFSNGSAGNGITRKTSFVASAVLGFALLLSACSPAPSPSASARPIAPEPSAEASPPVASSHLAFERTDDGGFTADFVIHPNGQLEVRQLGVGYPNWEYVVGPRVSIRMTDDDGRLFFAPLFTCPDPERQADMSVSEWGGPWGSFRTIEAGTYEAQLTIEERPHDDYHTTATMHLQNKGTGGSGSSSWSRHACERDPLKMPVQPSRPSEPALEYGEVTPGVMACDMATEYVPATWVEGDLYSFDEQADGQGLIGWPTDGRAGCGTFFTSSQIIVYPTPNAVDPAVVLEELALCHSSQLRRR